ncbi:MAG: UV DNA damage repair endonuclease UvsE [Bacillus sp. (in: firmicutes)]
MTLFRFGYVAMSMQLQNASPSKTMTFKQFSGIPDEEAAIAKLGRIANANLQNCLRLLRHNAAHDIHFFRFSSKLIPLANHPQLEGWDYLEPLSDSLAAIAAFLEDHPDMRVDFHPDHFVLLNTKDKDVFKMSMKVLQMHHDLLVGMGVDPRHRCVLHVGGGYDDKGRALEQFIQNWALVPLNIQNMIILENDDASFTVNDTLYLCEKLAVPLVFDYHHFLANKDVDEDLLLQWQRIVDTWRTSPLPVKMHISSPRDEKQFRAHADFIDVDMLWEFIEISNGTLDCLDLMIEAKRKDEALFRLMEDIGQNKEVKWKDSTSFTIE